MKKIKLVSPLLLAIILVGCASGESSKEVEKLKQENAELKKELKKEQPSNDSKENKKKEPKKEDNLVFKNNEEVMLYDNYVNKNELATLKITEVSTAQSSFPEFMSTLTDEFDIGKMIAVTIEYKNLGLEQGFVPSVFEFQGFDVDGNALERQNRQEGNDAVSKGRASKTKIFFNLPSEGSNYNEIEIDYVSGSNKIGTFKLDVTH